MSLTLRVAATTGTQTALRGLAIAHVATLAALGLACTSFAARADPPGMPGPHRSPGVRAGQMAPSPGRWYDGAYGHNRYYPAPGTAVRVLPQGSRWVVWGGVNYRYHSGVWYGTGPLGYVVVQPPFGVVIADLPAFATVVTIAGIGYLYANGVYYREHVGGGYEVVPPPLDSTTVAPERSFVYPRNGQSAQQQASDEYECHRWAVAQTGFDPTAAATGAAAASPTQRADYQRARTACLDGRGYTVR